MTCHLCCSSKLAIGSARSRGTGPNQWAVDDEMQSPPWRTNKHKLIKSVVIPERSTTAQCSLKYLFWGHFSPGKHEIVHNIIEEVNRRLFKISRFYFSWGSFFWPLTAFCFHSLFYGQAKRPSWEKLVLSLPPGWKKCRNLSCQGVWNRNIFPAARCGRSVIRYEAEETAKNWQ